MRVRIQLLTRMNTTLGIDKARLNMELNQDNMLVGGRMVGSNGALSASRGNGVVTLVDVEEVPPKFCAWGTTPRSFYCDGIEAWWSNSKKDKAKGSAGSYGLNFPSYHHQKLKEPPLLTTSGF